MPIWAIPLCKQADGKLFQVFPNSIHTDNRIKAGQSIQIGAADDRFRWIVGEPFCEESIVVIASRCNDKDKIHLTTAVFYDKAAESTTCGADREACVGREGQTTVGHYRTKVGDLLAAVNICYMFPQEARKIL